jgi:hypothetical protein
MLAMVAAAFIGLTGGIHAATSTSGTIVHGTYVGSGSFASGSGAVSGSGGLPSSISSDEVNPESGDDAEFPRSGNGAIRVPADHVPQPAPNAVSGDNSSVAGSFAGLDHFDTRFGSSDGNNAFSLEPPDQGLCVGNGFTIEAVNDVMTVFNASGARVAPATSMNTFFGLPVAIDRVHGNKRGPALSDPKCMYDADNGHFFVTMLVEPAGPDAAHLTERGQNLIAVSKTNDPTGSWNVYSIDATDDGQNGTPSHPGCPCLGDQPLIGADANGFYITTNEFSWFGNGFNGAQVYALSKADLESGAGATGIHIDVGETMATPDLGGIWYSIQPATIPPGGTYATNTEYFLSALQFGPSPLDDRIATWAMTGTNTLGTTNVVNLTNDVIASEVYGQPSASDQKAGSTPLAAVVAPLEGFGKINGNNPAQQEDFLNSNDDRMNQVVYANGNLYSGVNTAVASNGSSRSGIAYFIVTPSVSGGQVSGTMAGQGYVSLQHDDVLFPSIGVTASGKAVMAFTVAGPDYYPSAGYVAIDSAGNAGAVHISGAGVGPEDGFTGYFPFGNNSTGFTGRVARWGDYSAAVADEHGNVWLAAEYIGQTCSLAQFEADTTCGGTRTLLANWGTFVTEVTP